MTPKLILASAGAGKSYRIVKQALEKADIGQTVLLLTYTESNQKELLNKICQINKYKPSNIVIKGWFTFLLEDMIRPYQCCIFQDRIQGIYFNSSDPHKRNGRTIKGRSEQKNGSYNSLYFLTKSGRKAHTAYLSKLSARVQKEAQAKTTNRLAGIYDAVLIDEVQDLVGWDFDIIEAISKINDCEFVCVGDFRQTIYATSLAQKSPKTQAEKLTVFEKIGFKLEHMNISWRCIQPICDFSDLVHSKEKYYPATSSKVKVVPKEFSEHLGIFSVSTDLVSEYINSYNPVILRLNKITCPELCAGHKTFNFGEAKGLGFDRVLILPTENQKGFISGKGKAFDGGKTEKAKNAFYVAITRAKYSVAFVYNGDDTISSIDKWTPG